MAKRQIGSRLRKDGRRQLLVYLDPELVKKLKKVAIDDDRNVYEIVEDSVRDWLAERSGDIISK